MTSNHITSKWGTPRNHDGGRKGAKHTGPARDIDPAKRAKRDRIATILKDYLGMEGFVSVRQRGAHLSFCIRGDEIANAEAGQVDSGSGRDGDKATKLAVKGKDGLYASVTVADMASKSGTVAHLDQGAKKKCWIVKVVDANGRATYKPAGMAFVNGEAKPLRESAARKFVALWVAGAMTPNSARKDGKRVKANIRTKDGKGTRYIFRFNGSDTAAYYHDGRFESLGDNGKPFEEYLRSAGIPCVETGNERIAEIAKIMVSPGYASDIDEKAEPYDDNMEHFERDLAEAHKAGFHIKGYVAGSSILDYVWHIDSKGVLRGKRAVEDVAPVLGGEQPRKQRGPRVGRKAGYKRSVAPRTIGSAETAAKMAAALAN